MGYNEFMKDENKKNECCEIHSKKCNCHGGHGGSGGAIYGLGVIGALFYFLKGAATFGAVVMGIGKSIFWPALMIFKLLTLLQM